MPAERARDAEVVKYIRAVSSQTKYPIVNIDQLMSALGGESSVLEFAGRRIPAGRLREIIPEQSFPIDSEEDLLAKAQALYASHSTSRTRPRPEAIAEARKMFPGFSRVDLDFSRVAVPNSGTAFGVARLPKG